MVYLSAGTFGLSVVDITNAINPEVTVSNLNVKPAKDITVFGDYLFISTSEQGVRIAEVSNPRTPDIRERTLTNGYANGVAISEDGNTCLWRVVKWELAFLISQILMKVTEYTPPIMGGFSGI